MGHHPSVLYSISKLLNDIGSDFQDEGITWISDILQKNEEKLVCNLETNTVYYIENLCRRFVLINRKKIKTTSQLKEQFIIILNFLIQKGSVIGYLLRENIL